MGPTPTSKTRWELGGLSCFSFLLFGIFLGQWALLCLAKVDQGHKSAWVEKQASTSNEWPEENDLWIVSKAIPSKSLQTSNKPCHGWIPMYLRHRHQVHDLMAISEPAGWESFVLKRNSVSSLLHTDCIIDYNGTGKRTTFLGLRNHRLQSSDLRLTPYEIILRISKWSTTKPAMDFRHPNMLFPWFSNSNIYNIQPFSCHLYEFCKCLPDVCHYVAVFTKRHIAPCIFHEVWPCGGWSLRWHHGLATATGWKAGRDDHLSRVTKEVLERF